MKQTIFFMAVLSVFAATATIRAQNYRFEAELGMLGGTSIQNFTPGFSGTGYVNFNSGDYVQVQAAVPDGLYELWVGYNSPHGFKGYGYSVNGASGSGGFDGNGNQWSATRAGAFDLSGTTNTLQIDRGWGWFNVDYFELRPFTPPTLQPVAGQLANPRADNRTQILMNYLVSQYGQKTLSGQQHESSSNQSFPVQNYLNKSGGVVPAIRGGDFIEYSPSRLQNGANPRNETEQTIAWAQSTGGIVTMMWHWNAPANLVNTPCGGNCGANDWPWWRGFSTQGTTFNLPGALADPAGNDYQLILRDVDAIATELQKFEDAGVPVIWRPLHEAQGGWFWWGAHGPETFKQLWNLVYDRLTNHHGLDNLIWEFTSSASEGNHLDWYPGDNVVDMIGLDIYTSADDTMNGQWLDILEHYNGRKMIALSETGTLPDAEAMEKWGIDWSYFSPWSGSFVDAMSPTELQALLNHEKIVNLNDLPVLPWSNLAAALPGDYNLDGTVDAADYVVWRDAVGQTGTGLAADGDGNGTVDESDLHGVAVVLRRVAQQRCRCQRGCSRAARFVAAKCGRRDPACHANFPTSGLCAIIWPHRPPISAAHSKAMGPAHQGSCAMNPTATAILLLVGSNVFMTFAWYAHLKNMSHQPLVVAILASWGIALFEYMLQVPANRIGFGQMTLPQLKMLQEVITLAVFVPFSIWYMHQPVRTDFLWAGFCLLGAVYFMFRGVGAAG